MSSIGSFVKYKVLEQCIDAIRKLMGYYKVRLLWVPGHSDVEVNEVVDKIVKRGSTMLPSLDFFFAEIRNWVIGKNKQSLLHISDRDSLYYYLPYLFTYVDPLVF